MASLPADELGGTSTFCTPLLPKFKEATDEVGDEPFDYGVSNIGSGESNVAEVDIRSFPGIVDFFLFSSLRGLGVRS